MYSKHYFVFFDKTNDFTIDEFGNIGRTMEDGPFNSNEIGRHVDTETIFMVRANAEKLINAWEGLDVYYIGDNVIHLHGQPLGYVSITTPTTAWRNTTNRNAWVQTIKDYIWGIYNRLPWLDWQYVFDASQCYCNNAPCCGSWSKWDIFKANCKCKQKFTGCKFYYNNSLLIEMSCWWYIATDRQWQEVTGCGCGNGSCNCDHYWYRLHNANWATRHVNQQKTDFQNKWINPLNSNQIYWLY